jgi:hypothetical protein
MSKVTLEKFYRPNFKEIEISELLQDVELVIYHSMWFEYKVNNNRKGKILYHEEYAKAYDGDKNYTILTAKDLRYKNNYYITQTDFKKIMEYLKINKIRTCMYDMEENYDV